MFFSSHPTGAFKRNDASGLDKILRKARTRVGARSKRSYKSNSSKSHKSSKSKSQKRRRRYSSSDDESDQEEDEDDESEAYSSDYDSGYASQKKKIKVDVEPRTVEFDSVSEVEQRPTSRRRLSEVIREQASRRIPSFAPLPISFVRESSSHTIASTSSSTLPSTSTPTWALPYQPSQKIVEKLGYYRPEASEDQYPARIPAKPYYYPSRIYNEQVHSQLEPTFTMTSINMNSGYIIASPECSSPSPDYSSPSSSYSPWSQSPVNSRSSFSAYSEDEVDFTVVTKSGTSDFERVGLGIDELDATLFERDIRNSPSRETSPGPFDLFGTFIV